MSKNEETIMAKSKQASLESCKEAVPKKHQDMLTKAKNKFINISEALKTNKILNGELDPKKSKTQTTLDYFFRSCPPKIEKGQFVSNSRARDSSKRASSLQKQNSVGAYPIKINVVEAEDEEELDRPGELSLSKIYMDKSEEYRETAALALERPRKKLSFREPEISGYSIRCDKKNGKKSQVPELKRSLSAQNNVNQHSGSWEDLHLESQAMRVVRTVGQAFEVCHKLHINAPEADQPDHDENETLTQDLVSDHISDVMSDKPKKDFLSETISDKNSIPTEENILDDLSYNDHHDLSKLCQPDPYSMPIPNKTKKAATLSGETYMSPLSDGFLTCGSGSGSGSMRNTIFSTGSAVSAHHEIQLLKEQLEQQTQQTQAALAQLQLVREQLATEQSARMEAQARTHQLLVHNKELLDHIAALVAHLQGGEGVAQTNSGPNVAMPQLSSTAKVERWFELIESLPISRPESGFISYQDQENDDEEEEERAILERTRSLLSKMSARKKRKLLSLKLGKVTTF